jgi:hypothetical protein
MKASDFSIMWISALPVFNSPLTSESNPGRKDLPHCCE